MKPKVSLSYAQAGVDTAKEEYALKRLLKWTERSFSLRTDLGCPKLKTGYFANVIDIGEGIGLAISTDGVGTKILVAQMVGKYNTIGIDCIAMNVNDIICVGAEPLSMTDYIAIEDPHPDLLEEIGKGLYEGAKIAKVSISGGEMAQVKEMIRGSRNGYGLDLVGTCVGKVPLDKIIIGQNIEEYDVVIGLRSSGIHSNGLTLARKVFFEKANFEIDKHVKELGRTIGEELLEPTHIYVPEITEMLTRDLNLKALINITGDGFLNLTRVEADVGYVIDFLPEPQPIFSLLQEFGDIDKAEMFTVYNMGIGFCVISPQSEVDAIMSIAKKHGVDSYRIGYAVEDPEKKVVIQPEKLIGKGNRFFEAS